MYVNLKEGAKEEDLVSHISQYEAFLKRKGVKGWGGYTVYKHYYFGENRRRYQIWQKFDNLAVIDSIIQLKYDPEYKAIKPSLEDIADVENHIDECVSEVYPNPEPPSSPQ